MKICNPQHLESGMVVKRHWPRQNLKHQPPRSGHICGKFEGTPGSSTLVQVQPLAADQSSSGVGPGKLVNGTAIAYDGVPDVGLKILGKRRICHKDGNQAIDELGETPQQKGPFGQTLQ